MFLLEPPLFSEEFRVICSIYNMHDSYIFIYFADLLYLYSSIMNTKEVTISFGAPIPTISQTYRVADEPNNKTLIQGGEEGAWGSGRPVTPPVTLPVSEGAGVPGTSANPPLTSVSNQPSDIGYTFVCLLVGMCVV